MVRHLFVVVAGASIAACGPQELVADEASEAVTASAGLSTTETVISFHQGWNISRSNLFTEGGTVRVAYDPDRLPQCRGEQNGKPAWSITGYYRINEGPVGTFEAGGFSPSGGSQAPVFSLSEPGTLSLWFQVTNRWGCSAWDSNFDRNFTFEIGPRPTVVFPREGGYEVQGVLGATPVLTVDYDLERLPRCRQTYNGAGTWEILAYYRFDGGEVKYVPVTTPEGMGRVKAPAKIAIPDGARWVELWFKNADRAGCVGWDSNFDQNYRFAVH